MEKETESLAQMTSLDFGSADGCSPDGEARVRKLWEAKEGADLPFVAGYLGAELEYMSWDSGGEYLYALTVITTIGYGVFVPSTFDGRCFTGTMLDISKH
jgi:hypothetical protein